MYYPVFLSLNGEKRYLTMFKNPGSVSNYEAIMPQYYAVESRALIIRRHSQGEFCVKDLLKTNESYHCGYYRSI